MKTTIFRSFVLLVSIVVIITLFYYYNITTHRHYFAVNLELFDQENRAGKSEIGCKFARLLIDDPLIKPHLKTYGPLNCTKEKNWVESVGDGRFYINQDTIRRHGQIECKYSRIERVDDWHYEEIDLGILVNGTEFHGDSFRVICHAIKDSSTYNVLHAAVPNPTMEIRERIEMTREKLAGRRMDLNVLIYLADSVSRMNFIRNCPKFYALLTQEMGAYVMEGFNIVGEGTIGAMIPMTTGHFQSELPEARYNNWNLGILNSILNGTYLDDWPLIFKKYEADGYVTSFAEEWPDTGAFNLLVKGFKATPVDHYLRALLMADAASQRKNDSYCIGDTPRAIMFCKFFREMQIAYRPIGGRHFSIFFQTDLSHDDYNTVQQLDEHWAHHFDQLYRQGFLNDTLLIVMGYHGPRFGPVRQTQSGKLEEKLPFLALVFPPWFKRRFPKSHANLIKNQKRLTTHFDLHATLLQVLNFEEDGGVGNVGTRGISLFREVPVERTCVHAHTQVRFCSCLDWNDVEEAEKDPVVVQATREVIDYFNRQIQVIPGRCANLSLEKIMWARLLKPSDQLMAFKTISLVDNIYQFITENSTIDVNIYQFRFITQPGGADFESSVSYFVKEKKYSMSSDDISRLNRYHDQAFCVLKTHIHLRLFCYCV